MLATNLIEQIKIELNRLNILDYLIIKIISSNRIAVYPSKDKGTENIIDIFSYCPNKLLEILKTLKSASLDRKQQDWLWPLVQKADFKWQAATTGELIKLLQEFPPKTKIIFVENNDINFQDPYNKKYLKTEIKQSEDDKNIVFLIAVKNSYASDLS